MNSNFLKKAPNLLPHVMIGAGLVLAIGVVFVSLPKNGKPKKPLTIGDVARLDRSKADSVYNTPKAKDAYKAFVDKWKDSPDKHVQDQVGAARIRLAYVVSKEKNWPESRRIFKEAAKEYKGTGSLGGDFGGIPDQALYQAAATLKAEGKLKEYRAALIDFITNQPLSPLVDACYKRIVQLDGHSSGNLDALLQRAHDKQQEKIRFEMSVCGPKALVYLLEAEGKGKFDYKTLAKECGTKDSGTTMESLRECLKKHGLEYFGFRVAKADLPNIQVPAVMFQQDHYVIVTKADSRGLTVYDPTRERTTELPLADIKDPQFNAILLLKSAPSSEAN